MAEIRRDDIKHLLKSRSGIVKIGSINKTKAFSARGEVVKRRAWGNGLEVCIAKNDNVCPTCHAKTWSTFPFETNGNAMQCTRCGWSYCPESEL